MAKQDVCFVDLQRKKSFATKVAQVPMLGDVIRFPLRCVRVDAVVYNVEDFHKGVLWHHPYVFVSDATKYEVESLKPPGLDFTKTALPSEF